MNLREILVFVPLIAWALWIGLYPKPYFDILRQPVTEIVQRVKPGYFAATAARDQGSGVRDQGVVASAEVAK